MQSDEPNVVPQYSLRLPWRHPWCKQVILHGKPLQVACTRRALKALGARKHALVVEMQLYFSCMIVTQLRFHELPPGPPTVTVLPQLQVFFHPVMKRDCSLEDLYSRVVPFSDFPIVGVERFIPKQLYLDYRRGAWSGKYRW